MAVGPSDSKRLISATALYGFADLIVMAVGGFLLLPLYTRTLSKPEFGLYVIIRTNTEIFTYLLALGLPSAVARVYFDYRRRDQHIEYLSSVLGFYLLALGLFLLVMVAWGDGIWHLLSPEVDSWPYLWFCVALASMGFFATLGSLWLRLEERATAVGIQQVGTSLVLIAVATFNLLVLKSGLSGLLIALLVSTACSSLALPWLFGRRIRFAIRWQHVADSLTYSAPILVSYLAYFVLNRVNTIILQRHVSLDQIAVFGLAQQLALVVSISAAAFGKAIQPAVYGSEGDAALQLLYRSARLLLLVMFSISSTLVMFAAELIALVGSRQYRSDHVTVTILVIGSFLYAFSIVSNTSLLYHRRPKTSVAISLVGAGMSAGLGLWLIPLYQIHGAAIATAAASLGTSLLSNHVASRISGVSFLRPMLVAGCGSCLLAILADWVQGLDIGALGIIATKALIAAATMIGLYLLYLRGESGRPRST